MELLTLEPQTGQTVSQARGRYLYAIIDGDVDQELYGSTGLENGEVYGIGEDGIVAVVSDIVRQRRSGPSAGDWPLITTS